jgi:hypothetical protein
MSENMLVFRSSSTATPRAATNNSFFNIFMVLAADYRYKVNLNLGIVAIEHLRFAPELINVRENGEKR